MSVLEFITKVDNPRLAVEELARVVRPGGHLFIATPRPWPREYHSHRWLGDLVRTAGSRWSSQSRQLRGWLPGWERLPLGPELSGLAPASVRPVLRAGASHLLPHLTRWQKLLLREPL